MSTPSAAERHQEDDPVPTPAELRAKATVVLNRLWERLEGLTAQHADPALLAELLHAGLHCEELRQELEVFHANQAAADTMAEFAALIAAGQPARPRARHARHAKPYLRVAGPADVTLRDDEDTLWLGLATAR